MESGVDVQEEKTGVYFRCTICNSDDGGRMGKRRDLSAVGWVQTNQGGGV